MFEKLIHLEGIDPLEFFGVNNGQNEPDQIFFSETNYRLSGQRRDHQG